MFIELYHDFPGRETKKPERFCATARYLTDVPTQARKVTVDRQFTPQDSSAVIGSPGTDAHRYYAYPLAAILAVGIDVPASIVMTGALIPTICIGVSANYVTEKFKQNTPPHVSAE